MNLTVKGEFVAAGKPRYWGENNSHYATKFWVNTDTDTEYPSMAEFEVYKDKVDLTKFAPGDKVTISFAISGRKVEYQKDGQTKKAFFQSLNAWRVEKSENPEPQQTASSPANEPEPPDDDLPF